MSFLFNPKPLGDCYDNLSADLASNRENQRSFFGPNTLHPSLVDDPDLIISSKHVQTPFPSFTVESKTGSFSTTDNFSQFNTCLSASNLQTVSLDGSVENPSSWYSTFPLDGPRNSYPFYQQSQVHSFSDLPLFHPSELVPDNPELYTPISSFAYSNYQYLGNQAVLLESNNIDIRRKQYASSFFDNQPCPEITHQSSLIGNNIHSSCLTDNAFNSDAVLHRFNQKSVSFVSHDHFIEQNEKKGGLAQTMMTLAHVNGADYLSIDTKRKASEEGRGQEEWKRRRNLHRCKLCNMSFSTGNALGGHMSYHAKQRKLEAKNIAQLSRQPLDSDVAFACALASGLRGSVNPFMNTFRW